VDFDIDQHYDQYDSNNYNVNLDCGRDLLDDYNGNADRAPMHNRVGGSWVRTGSGGAVP